MNTKEKLTFSNSIDILQQKKHKRGMMFGLGNMLKILAEFDNPHNNLKNSVHIAGTNGKGSTTYALASTLKALGFRVGTYTSPHIDSYTERIQSNLTPISEQSFASLFNDVFHTSAYNDLTEFEVLTMMAINYFNYHKHDYVIIETGLGGRLDATNILHPICTAITHISLDHQEF